MSGRSGWGCRRPRPRWRSRTTRQCRPRCADRLVPRLRSAADALRAALQARAGDRARQLTATLAGRARDEQAHVEATLSELAATIRREALGEHGDQLQLITGLELDAGDRVQVERDLRSLRARLDAIPEEIESRAGGDRRPLRRAGPPVVPGRGHVARARRSAAVDGRARRRSRSRIGDHHAEWLSLVETSGPFLTVPVLKRVLPDGLEATTLLTRPPRRVRGVAAGPGTAATVGSAGCSTSCSALRDARREATEADPSHRVAEQGVTLRPSYVVRDRGGTAIRWCCSCTATSRARRSTGRSPGEAWAASPLDRAAELARAAGVPLALVTDGARWTLVWARAGESTGTCTWRAELWLEEPITLRAFVTLLGARRFFALPVEEGLAALLQESASKPAGGRRPARRAGPPRGRAADRDARPRRPRPPRRAARRTSRAPRSTAGRSR